MKLRSKLGISIPIVLIAIAVVCWYTVGSFREWADTWIYFVRIETRLAIHSPPPRCKRRESAFNSRVEHIKQDAKNSLKIGTKRNEVIDFFASEDIPISYEQIEGRNEATGTISVHGDPACYSLACGDDAALIGVRVEVDENGTVVSDPVVVGMYTDCL